MIHVCFSLYDKAGNYSKFLGTTMLSLFDNLNSSSWSITVHILHDNTLTDDNRDKFSYIAGRYKQHVKFYNVEELCADKTAEINKIFLEADKMRFSRAMFYRFLIPHVLPAEIKKVIYLDADIIVNLDINELWRIDPGDKPLGAIPNLFQIKDEKASLERTNKFMKLCKEGFVKAEDYFNSGVLLLNLIFMRNADDILIHGMEFIGERPLQYPDQDILNYCFSTSILKLPVKFNRYVMLARPENELTIEQKIYHYAGGKAGLGIDMSDPFNRLWWSYFIKTPWFDLNMISNLVQAFAELDIARENSIWKISSDMAGKARAFVVDEENVERLEKHFSVRDKEEVFIIDPKIEDYFLQLIDLMDAAKGKKIFFIGIPKIAPKLKKSGFIDGKDFIDVSGFYSPAWKNPAEAYNLVVTM